MIVKNEEETLPLAIASVKELADEIVIYDTGSDDKTVWIAQELGARVFMDGDYLHKAKSRNHIMEYAIGDWIVILDADEQITDPIGLKQFLNETDAQAIYIKLAYMNGDNPTLSYPQMRIWKRGTFEYKYRAHEIPVPLNGWGKIEYTDFIWEHRPPANRQWKSDYTLKRLLLDVEENPEDARPLYYLGRQYSYAKQWKDGAETLEKYIGMAGRDEADAYYYLGICYKGLENNKEYISALYQACAIQPGRREWWAELASYYYQEGKYQVATGLLKCALEQSLPDTYTYHYWYGSPAYDLLARCLYKQKRYEKGLEYAQKAIELEPDNERLQKNLLWFEMNLGDMDAFYQLYGPDIHSGCDRHKAIAKLVEGQKVLDVGCGTGDLLLLLQDRIEYLVGSDISQVALDMAGERGVKAQLKKSDKIFGSDWHTIIMSQMLEHLEDDEALIREVKYKLARGGKLIVSVPNNGAIPSPDHKRDYTQQSLSELLSIIGKPVLHSWSGEQHRILMSVKNS